MGTAGGISARCQFPPGCKMATVAAAAAVYLLLLASSVGGVRDHPSVVCTRQGAVRGAYGESRDGRPFLAFYNLPFARPPVGRLRFKDPQPPRTWENIRDATVPGSHCTQTQMYQKDDISGVEDCLYLNVFTPKLTPKHLLPVMFWIFGGAWISGGANWVEPRFLLDENVVVVSTNYRVGHLGFLSTEDRAASGNYGLKDIVAGLKWVRENIEVFGGSPNRVTIFGDSVGGATVQYLLMSPLSQGLFQQAISQSGSALSAWALPEPGAAEKARKLARIVGCPVYPSELLVACLREVDDYEIASTYKHFVEWDIDPIIPFRPVVEGEGQNSFLPKHPWELRPSVGIPWIIGVNEDEGCLRTSALYRNKTLLDELKYNFRELLPLTMLYDRAPRAAYITQQIINFYFQYPEFTIQKLSKIYSDAYFNWNADETVRLYKDVNPIYYYLLSYEGKYSLAGDDSDEFGVCHFDELLYLFSNNSFISNTDRLPKKDENVSRNMIKLWTNFAKTGNPTPDDEPIHWPRVTSDDDPEYLDIGATLEVKKGLFKERMAFWRSLPVRET